MLILIRFSGDIATKAKGTRAHFQRHLAHNIKDALSSEGVQYNLRRDWSRFFIETEERRALEVLPRVFGIKSISIVEARAVRNLDDVVREGEALFKGRLHGKSFAVRARLGSPEQFDFGAMAIERALGAALLPYASRVNLDEPDVTVHVELRDGNAFFFTDQMMGYGGLPIGVEGQAMALVSGGFDSAVAAWLLLKRGVALDYVSCNLGGAAHAQGVLRVLKILAERWSYGYQPHLHAVNFNEVLKELQSKADTKYWQVLLKRLMYRCAEKIAKERKALGIVTGEAVGQVSSQTLANLFAISQSVQMPVLRPLLGFDKEEIIKYSKQIGTYEFSATVQEYCAIVPKHPAISAPLKNVLAEEAKLDLSVLDRAIAERKVLKLRALRPEDLEIPQLEIAEIPEGAVVIDLRPRRSYEAWHWPEAIHSDFLQALNNYSAFDRDKTYVLYCELGLKSAHLAELMRQAGFRAYNFKGGLRALLRYAIERNLVPPELLPQI